MKAIIFGINSQDGFYLKEILLQQRIEVIGVSRSMGDWIQGNVADFALVENLIKVNQPDFVFHLAANSSTSHSIVFENHETISTGTFNILEAVHKHQPKAKVFLSGSAVQFENKGLPINESTPFAALSPYAVSRIQSVYAGRYYRRLGVKVYVGYLFNHDSPLRTERHVNQKIAMAVKRIANGSAEKIEIGNSQVKKEFNFAGDIMQAAWTLVNQDKVFEAVIGSGKAYSIEDWIQRCFQKIGRNWKEYITERSDFVSEYNILVSDPATILSLGWKPGYDIDQLSSLMIKGE